MVFINSYFLAEQFCFELIRKTTKGVYIVQQPGSYRTRGNHLSPATARFGGSIPSLVAQPQSKHTACLRLPRSSGKNGTYS